MTRTEIIAHIDAELSRLERARDFLAAALTDLPSKLMRKVEKKLPSKSRKPTAISAPGPMSPPLVSAVAAATPQPKAEPQVHRVPPRRRMERRGSSSEKASKSTAALSGLVPSGPVAVSANEARKVQERSAPAPAMPTMSELRPEASSERSLGSLIQAFERRAGLNGAETP